MLADTANTYNTNMIETGFSRSIIADQLSMLENMLSTMSDNQKIKMFKNIGLRPEGELREDYTKEANRIGLGIGKMLESLELAENINKERLNNSKKEYYSGHLFQMGANIVNVKDSEVRAKEFPAIDTIKRMLKNRLEADKKVTHTEFEKAGVKLSKDTNYVLNLADIVEGKTQIESNANVVKILEGNAVRGSNIIKTLSANDTVEIIGEFKRPSKPNKQSRMFDRLIKAIRNSGASVVANGKLVKDTKPEITQTTTVDTKAEEAFTKSDLSWITARLAEGIDAEAMEVLSKNKEQAVIELDREITEYQKELDEASKQNDKETVRDFTKAIKNLNKAKEQLKQEEGKMTTNEIIKAAKECAKG